MMSWSSRPRSLETQDLDGKGKTDTKTVIIKTETKTKSLEMQDLDSKVKTATETVIIKIETKTKSLEMQDRDSKGKTQTVIIKTDQDQESRDARPRVSRRKI